MSEAQAVEVPTANRFAVLALGLPKDTVPPVSDPRWWGWTRPLADFLAAPRTWAELEGWAQAGRVRVEVLRHLLAALEYMGEADTEGSDHWLTWMHEPPARKTRSRSKPEPRRATKPTPQERPSDPPPAADAEAAA